MNTEFFEALALLEKERGIPADYLLEKIEAAVVIAVKKDYNCGDNVLVDIEWDGDEVRVNRREG